MSYVIDLHPKKQKFRIGEVVYIKKIEEPCMKYFNECCFAVVLNSYSQKYGGDNYASYQLAIKTQSGNWTEASWYNELHLKSVKDIKLCKKLEKSYRLAWRLT